MVGSTFAYFTATVDGEGGTADVVNASTISKVEATYSEGSRIDVDPEASAIAPNWTGEKTITITNGNDADIDFTISFAEYDNKNFENLQYKLEATSGTASSIVGTTTSADDNFVKMESGSTLKAEGATTEVKNTLVTGHLVKGATQTFKLTIRLKETGEAQTNDALGSFTGKLTAEAKASKIVEN